jgi:voltage-gated potassium channel
VRGAPRGPPPTPPNLGVTAGDVRLEANRHVDAPQSGRPNPQVAVIPLLLAFRGLARAIAAVLRDPETKALPIVAGALVLTGTIFYWRFEDWTIIEALYFSVVTLTTVGYGDLTPTTAGTQIFTIIYILTGLGVLVALLSSVAQQYLRLKAEGDPMRERLRAGRRRDPSN